MSLNATATYTGPAEASQAIATSFLAPAYVGYIIQFLLFGSFVTNLFAYLGTSNYKNDTRTNRIYIWVVFALCSLATGLNAFEAIYHAVSQNRSAEALYMITVPDALTPMVTGTIGLVVHSFLTVRASKLFHRKRVYRTAFLGSLSLVILVAWLGSLGAGIASLGFTFGFVDQIEALSLDYNTMCGVWMWLSAAVDVALSATLYLSIRSHLHEGTESTDHVLRRIMSTAARTASYTTVFAVVGALMSVVFPQDNIVTVDILFAFDLPLAALYSLSLLTTLASRKSLLHHPNSVPVAYPSFHVGGTGSGNGSGNHPPAAPASPRAHSEKRPLPSGFADVQLQAFGVTVTKEVASKVDFADDGIEMGPTRGNSKRASPLTPYTDF